MNAEWSFIFFLIHTAVFYVLLLFLFLIKISAAARFFVLSTVQYIYTVATKQPTAAGFGGARRRGAKEASAPSRTVPFSLSPREKRTTHFLNHLSYCHIGNKIDGTVQSSINVFNLRYKTEQMRICLVVQYRNEKN